MWEIYCTVVTNTKLHVLLPKAERDAFVKALENDFRSVVDATCNVNVEHAEAQNPVDRKNILDAVDGPDMLEEMSARRLSLSSPLGRGGKETPRD